MARLLDVNPGNGFHGQQLSSSPVSTPLLTSLAKEQGLAPKINIDPASSPMKLDNAGSASATSTPMAVPPGFNPISMFSAHPSAMSSLPDFPSPGSDHMRLGNSAALAQWIQSQTANAAAAAASAAGGDLAEHSPPAKDEPMSPREGSSGGSDYAAI